MVSSILYCFRCIYETLTLLLSYFFTANVKSRSAIKKRQKGGLNNFNSSTNRSGNQSASSDGADSKTNRNSNKSKFLKSIRGKLGGADGSEDEQSEQGSLVSDSVDRSQRSLASPRKFFIYFYLQNRLLIHL